METCHCHLVCVGYRKERFLTECYLCYVFYVTIKLVNLYSTMSKKQEVEIRESYLDSVLLLTIF